MRALVGLTACLCAVPAQAQWLNYKTPGIPRAADGSPDLSAPVPRSAYGKPDLTGVWRVDLSAQGPPNAQPWAEALAKKRMEDLRRDSPEALCLPGPIANMGVGKIVQTPGLLLMLYGGTLYRQIFLDGRELPEDPNSDWMGYSVGRWGGDTLIVDTFGFNDRTWLTGNGLPGSPKLRVTERIHRSDFGHLEVQAAYADPSVLEARWDVTSKYVLDDVQPLEYVCNENERDRVHMTGKASDLKSVKLDPKILAEYAGTYVYQNHVYIFSVSGGQLLLSEGPSAFLLTTLSETAFATNNGVRYDFFRDDRGSVAYIVAQTFDGDIKATRGK
ncbi:MAG TPA: hypothetical protein VG297_08630 [Bryobacteraceae bacterium]|nr:hypothetical protein [Bryobacteraceae bacterium]